MTCPPRRSAAGGILAKFARNRTLKLAALGALRSRDEAVDHRLKQRHRHAPAQHHGIVEAAQVVFRAERRLRLFAQAIDLEMADLVAARLSRHRAVTVDLPGDRAAVVAI